MQHLGAVVRRRRLALCLSQEQLAERVPCNRNYVGMIERGEHNPTTTKLRGFATALNTTVSSLTRSAGI